MKFNSREEELNYAADECMRGITEVLGRGRLSPLEELDCRDELLLTLKRIIPETGQVNLKQLIDEKRGQTTMRAFADSINYAESTLSEVYNGVRTPSKQLLQKLGVEQIKTISHRRWR